ncbi:DEAD/DEAH box helicase, partial [Saprospiraceae bacterium]|nr:DEAD/DEAH box helicase [Saprospiraceae bacterium]
MQLKAAYYIDEIAEAIYSKIGITLGKVLYRRAGFRIPDLEDKSEKINPVFAVIYNQISRGVPTRAGLKVTKFLLKRYVKDQFREYDSNSITIRFKIKSDFWNGLSINASYYWFEDAIDSDDYLDQLKYLRLVELPLKVAQLQKIIIQLLLMEQIKATDSTIKVASDIDQDLLQVALEELSEWISHVCNLSNLPTYKVQLEASTIEDSDLYVTFNKTNQVQENLSRLHISVTPEPLVKNHFLFTEAIPYENLGEEREWEEDDKFLSKFEFSQPQFEVSLQYFLKNFFRNTSFLPGQLKIINRALQKKDVIGLLPTGGGKSLTYQLSGLLQPGIVAIVDPINSLMKDQHSKLINNGMNSSAFINAMLKTKKRKRRLFQLTNGELLFVFISPERFQIEEYREALGHVVKQKGVFHYAVIDEAHCVSEWGHDFRPSYLNLAPSIKKFLSKKNPKIIPTIMGLTATASFDVLADIQRELQVSEDAICTLPGDAIDRKELNFEIIPIDYTVDPNQPHYIRDKDIGFIKYPIIQDIIKSVPKRISKLNSSLINTFDEVSLFYKKENKYKNGGVIFCPTKSPKLGSGVIAVQNGYHAGKKYNSGLKQRIPTLEIGLFMGSGSMQTITHKEVLKEAAGSEKYQEDFLNNKTNLMICTKAFGMGIDKPNIRMTIHYGMPSSVEGFYQEAGRAGRNRQPALCALLYNEHDKLQNLDFINNSFKNVEREQKILEELMTEIQYDKKFFEKILSRKASEELGIKIKVSNWKDKMLYIDGPFTKDEEKEIKYGGIWMDSLLSSYKFTKNTTDDFYSKVHKVILNTIKKYAKGQDKLEWLKQKSTPGIQAQLSKMKAGEKMSLIIGFENEAATKLADHLQNLIQIGTENTSFEWVKVIYTAYDFANDKKEFLDNLLYNANTHLKLKPAAQNILKLESTQQIIQDNYDRIRNMTDTQKAIYRLTALGIIEDYMVDYLSRFFEITLKAKPIERYKEKLTAYLKRYIGEIPAIEKAEAAHQLAEENNLAPYHDVLINFVHQEIAEKRRRGVEYMSDLCLLGIEQGQQKFRENIKYYFTSKYARLDYLPKDTEDGNVSNVGIVRKYLQFISKPPDGLGTPIDNLKHLRGACARLILVNTNDNFALMVLNAITIMALEASRSTDYEELVATELFQNHRDKFYQGFCNFQSDSLDEISVVMETSIKLMSNITPKIKPELNQLREHIKAHYLLRKIKQIRKA